MYQGLILFILASTTRADERLDRLQNCHPPTPRETEAFNVRRDRGLAFVAGHADGEGWSLLVFGQTAQRCPLPAGVQACFKVNANCPGFEFLIARSSRGDGVGVTFDGRNIEDITNTARLGGKFRQLPAGTIDGNGRISGVIRPTPKPVLGLKCVSDRSDAVLTQFERALAKDIVSLKTQFDRETPVAERTWTKAAPYLAAIEKCAESRRLSEVAESERIKFSRLPGGPASNGDRPTELTPAAR